MGEYLFEYRAELPDKRELGIQYKVSQIMNKYSLAYGRNIQSDTVYFNGLVPVYKKARTRFSYDFKEYFTYRKAAKRGIKGNQIEGYKRTDARKSLVVDHGLTAYGTSPTEVISGDQGRQLYKLPYESIDHDPIYETFNKSRYEQDLSEYENFEVYNKDDDKTLTIYEYFEIHQDDPVTNFYEYFSSPAPTKWTEVGNEPISGTRDKELKEYPSFMAAGNPKGMGLYWNGFGHKFIPRLNAYKDYLGKRKVPDSNVYPDYMAALPRKGITVYYDYFGGRERPEVNVWEEYLGRMEPKTIDDSTLPSMLAFREMPGISLYGHHSGIRDRHGIGLYTQYQGSAKDKRANAFEQYFGRRDGFKSKMGESGAYGTLGGKDSMMDEIRELSRQVFESSYQETVSFNGKGSKRSQSDDAYRGGFKDIYGLHTEPDSYPFEKAGKYGIQSYMQYFEPQDKYINLDEGYTGFNKILKGVATADGASSFIKVDKHANLGINIIQGRQHEKEASVMTHYTGRKAVLRSLVDNFNLTATKAVERAILSVQGRFSKKVFMHISTTAAPYFAYKEVNRVLMGQELIFAESAAENLTLADMAASGWKDIYSAMADDELKSGVKDWHDAGVHDTGQHLWKDWHKGWMDESIPGGTKDWYHSFTVDDWKSFMKSWHDSMSQDGHCGGIASYRDAAYLNDAELSVGSKERHSFVIQDFGELATKWRLPMSLLSDVGAGIMVPAIKDRHSIMIFVDDWVSKEKADTSDEVGKSMEEHMNGSWATKLPHDLAGFFPDYFATDKARDVYLRCESLMLKKGAINSILNQEYHWAYLEGTTAQWIQSGIWADKDSRHAWTEEGSFSSKEHKYGKTEDGTSFLSKNGYHGLSEDDDAFFTKDYYYGQMGQDMLPFLKGWHQAGTEDMVSYGKGDKYLSYAETEVSISKALQGMEIMEGLEWFSKVKQELALINDMPDIGGIKTLNGIDVWNIQIGQKVPKGVDVLKTVNHARKLAKEIWVDEDETPNWAWVYETPDPLEKAVFDGLDELLIPERDTRYSDFEKLIFDAERRKPINPVKKIDENTWIAKYPIKHPTPNYEETGIEYIDVEAGLMRTIFLEYYRIWNANVFKFGGMDMAQAVSLMLNYLHQWILGYMPMTYMVQSLRVLRLIRWFGETAIIHNSQYVVSYEFGDLKSNLHKGTCDIPYEAENMWISAKDAVFMAVQKNQDAYVEFIINNASETTISLSVITLVGTVFVYIDGQEADAVTRTSHNLTYKVPYTGSPVRVRVLKPAMYNQDENFYIGYVTVKDQGFSGLEIKYDPLLKAGNKPLNEIAQKMIEYANLYEDNQKVFEDLYKGNLGISETYKLLENYWQIHHEGKTKGKRLTIKEV